MANKQAHELMVFTEFASAAGLTVDVQQVRVCEPPEPDIRWETGHALYFELGRIADEVGIEATLEAARGVSVTLSYDGSSPAPAPAEIRALQRKLSARYETAGLPVELVLYWDWEPQTPLTANEPPLGNPNLFVPLLGPPIRTLLTGNRNFTRVHYFRRRTRSILATFEPW